MKLYIDRDEMYPVYYFNEHCGFKEAVEVPEATVDYWKRGVAEYNKVQKEMEKYYYERDMQSVRR